ncbi:MAG: class I SAM-dependent methyltransferase [Ardenticatenaceae bacterium]
MQEYTTVLNDHYGQANLSQNIVAALQKAGKDLDALTRRDLIAFEEFHVRGRKATRELAQEAGLQSGMQLLDVGCGIGGPARTLAAEFGCQVTGVDITDEYCQAAEMLTDLVGLSGQASFRQGNALALPFEDGTFDVVWMQHMSMNIEDKERLYQEASRVLRPNGRLVFYALFSGDGTPLHYPVPWANDASLSFIVQPSQTYHLLGQLGFTEQTWRDVTDDCLAWFRQIRSNPQANTPSPLGLQLLMGANARQKVANLFRNLTEGRVRVIEAVWERAA